MSFRYPAHPNTNRTDPFQDAEGKNPFADEGVNPEKTSDNPYAVSAVSEPLLCPADSCVVVYPHRGRTIFWLGMTGCCSALGAALALAGILAASAIAGGLSVMCCLLLFIVSLTAGGTAWMIGRQDLRAIRAGAMDPDGLRLTQRGHRLGVAGTLISLGMLAAVVVVAALR